MLTFCAKSAGAAGHAERMDVGLLGGSSDAVADAVAGGPHQLRALGDQPLGRFRRFLHVIERAGEDLDDCRRRIGLLQAGLEAFVRREDERQLRTAERADLAHAEFAGDPARKIALLGKIVRPAVGVGDQLAGKVRTARRGKMDLREILGDVEDRLRQFDAVADDEIVAALRILANDRFGARRVPLLLADFERDQTLVGELLGAFQRDLVERAIVGQARDEDGDFQFLRRDAGAGGAAKRDDGGEADKELQTRKS